MYIERNLIFLKYKAEYSLLLPRLYAVSCSYHPIKDTLARNIISMCQRLVSDKLEKLDLTDFKRTENTLYILQLKNHRIMERLILEGTLNII